MIETGPTPGLNIAHYVHDIYFENGLDKGSIIFRRTFQSKESRMNLHGHRMSYKTVTILQVPAVQVSVPRPLAAILGLFRTFSVFVWHLRFSFGQADILVL